MMRLNLFCQIIFFSFFTLFGCMGSLYPALANASTLQMEFHDDKLSLSATDADIKTILLRISDEADIYVRFPKNLEKKINISLSNVILEKALSKILKGLNYATVFTVPIGADRPQVSKILIFRGYKASVRTRQVARRANQIQTRINNYKRGLRSLEKRLNKTESGSPAAQRYQRRIENYKRRIDRLERQIQ